MSKGRKRPDSERAEAVRLRKHGMTPASIARRLEVPAKTVSGWLRNVHRIDWPPLHRPLKWEIKKEA